MMGIKAVEPGTYKTVCGKGYFECDKDEPDEITLKYTGVDFFLSEGANSYYYWNDVTKTFKGAQISD